MTCAHLIRRAAQLAHHTVKPQHSRNGQQPLVLTTHPVWSCFCTAKASQDGVCVVCRQVWVLPDFCSAVAQPAVCQCGTGGAGWGVTQGDQQTPQWPILQTSCNATVCLVTVTAVHTSFLCYLLHKASKAAAASTHFASSVTARLAVQQIWCNWHARLHATHPR